MAKSDGDLEYVLGFDADMSKVDKALKDVGNKSGKGGSVSGLLGGILGNLSGGGGVGASLGGIVGTALGGPVGAAIGGAIGGGLDKVIAPAMAGVRKAFGVVTDPVGTLTGALTDLQGPLGAVGLMLPETLKPLVGMLTSFAGKANPAALRLFNEANEDVQAVIGRTFVPMLNAMRDGVRLFGDVLASVLPDTSEVTSALSTFQEAFRDFRSSVSEAMGEFGPVIRTGLLLVIRALGDAAAWAMRQLQPLVHWLGEFFRPIREALGLGHEARSSVGAAARSASMEGFGEYQRRLQLAAFAGPAAATPEVRATNAVQAAVDRLYTWISDNMTPEKITQAIRAALDVGTDQAITLAANSSASMVGGEEGLNLAAQGARDVGLDDLANWIENVSRTLRRRNR